MATSNVRFTTSEFAAPSTVPTRVLPELSFVQAASYNDRTRLLTVVLEGGTYIFRQVPRQVFNAFAESESPGRFFNARIRGQYEYSDTWSTFDGLTRARLMFA